MVFTPSLCSACLVRLVAALLLFHFSLFLFFPSFPQSLSTTYLHWHLSELPYFQYDFPDSMNDGTVETPSEEPTTAYDNRASFAPYLLQYLIQARGVCHENSLLAALMHLSLDLDPHSVSTRSLDEWSRFLDKVVNLINIKLSALEYKVAKVNHGAGKRVVGSKVVVQTPGGEELPPSSKFYVYVNLASSKETELATRFTAREIEFVKWAIGQFCLSSLEIRTIDASSAHATPLVKEVNRILIGGGGTWGKYTSFTVGSSKLFGFSSLTPLELEKLIVRLCDSKWFYRTERGEVGMDLKCVVELEEYLLSEYELPECQQCQKIVTHGVMCGNDACQSHGDSGSSRESWHIDCFQHYIAHVSERCAACDRSLQTDNIYII
ncbi:Smc5-Smc6 complex subunit NSE1 KNAG_0H02410 [Huiozyma naganishii CBS 8797]|uniref:Non-structural maintenance of chromosomes element 1 homolog n=1 Tax=Huiozyma naganishii (strain ATCC MYA-139 / BCRC 22969 / CBS 8797 / KCTC 17520 / NBRC 10181 / NCYC 3082 / Yp74L-3) TaxID=1071383 RepID=J7S9R2_HUIN7|nr:hypothetical protein KNAG_0H02410 [Kazachstania naganishii CBS 8797]CCK71656.1 hypothetical protein KNAG_0H02410 [Kazachstania naganishii CBS 8797]